MSILKIQNLQEIFVSFAKLNADWKVDRRYPEQAIQRFIKLNRNVFSFLGISASIDEIDYNKGIRLITSNFVGAAPLRSPSSGKYYTDIQVTSRFGEKVSELVYLLKDTLIPDYLDQNLHHSDCLRAPLYFDCINYFNSFLKAMREPWDKFNSIITIESHPSSSTNWSQYIQAAIDPNNALRFENRKNILSRRHREWQELTHVLSTAICEFESITTPLSIKLRYIPVVSILKRYLTVHECVKPQNKFQIHSADPLKIKKLKENANKLLGYNEVSNKSWRIDSAKLFERYVQYILKQVGTICGARVVCNDKFFIEGIYRPAWALRYLEPDVILYKDDASYFVDVKYKAHMFNVHTSSDTLKETFRADLHQVLAYSSFDSARDKIVILVYPSNGFKTIKLEAVNKIGDVHNQVFLIGIPFTTVGLDVFVEKLAEILRRYEIDVL